MRPVEKTFLLSSSPRIRTTSMVSVPFGPLYLIAVAFGMLSCRHHYRLTSPCTDKDIVVIPTAYQVRKYFHILFKPFLKNEVKCSDYHNTIV